MFLCNAFFPITFWFYASCIWLYKTDAQRWNSPEKPAFARGWDNDKNRWHPFMESSFVGWSFRFLNRAKLVQIVAKHDLKNASFYNWTTQPRIRIQSFTLVRRSRCKQLRWRVWWLHCLLFITSTCMNN